MAFFNQPVLPWVKTWDPQSTDFLGAELIWCKDRLELHACLSSKWHSVNMSIFKSSSGEERQIWECLEWRGGRVGHPDRLRVVATKLLTVPPALSWPFTECYMRSENTRRHQLKLYCRQVRMSL